MMIVTVAVAAVIVAGCGEAERLESELAAANVRIAMLDSALTNAQADLSEAIAHTDRLEQSLATTQSERDELAEFIKTANVQVSNLEDRLADARAEYDNSVKRLAAENEALRIDLRSWKSEAEDSRIRVRATERYTNTVIRTRDSLHQFVDAVRPWYSYYANEAGRGWTAKLFGAGKADAPGTPEPVVAGNESIGLDERR
jgi:chromosome segregation ATPase